MKKSDAVLSELKEHLPFTLAVSLVTGLLVAIFYSMGRIPSEALFEIMHPAHVLFSAIATSAIYWKYRGPEGGRRKAVLDGHDSGEPEGGRRKADSWIKTILVGVSGAILIGSLSDVVFPFLAGNLFSLHTHFHLPILEEPVLILGVAFFGSILGMYSDLFKTSHLLHVSLSVFASLFYLLAFSIEMSALGVLLISGLVFLTVYIPCCISDIVFPLLFLDKPCRTCGHFH
jgi:hypothetical protein